MTRQRAEGVICRSCGSRARRVFGGACECLDPCGCPRYGLCACCGGRMDRNLAGRGRPRKLEDGKPHPHPIVITEGPLAGTHPPSGKCARLRHLPDGEGLRFFDRKEIKDLLAYLRLLLNPASDVDLQRIINVPARGIGSTTVDRLTQHATERGLTLSEALDEAPAIGLGAAACRKIGAFQGLLAGLREAMADQDLGELATTVLEATGYRAMLAADGTDESRDRLENLQEFVGALEAFTEDDPEATLADYLEQVALVADADGDGESLAAVSDRRQRSAVARAKERARSEDT